MPRAIRTVLGALTLAGCGFGLWILFRALDPAATHHGERLIRVRFDEAGNLVEGAPVRTRGVRVGEVRAIALSPDGTGVLVEAAIDAQSSALVTTGSRFWVVRPRFEGITRGVEGLDTLLRNPYVVFDTPEGGERNPVESGALLVGLDGPPEEMRAGPMQPGDVEVTVLFARSFGVQPGAPVLLRDIRVGEVRSVELESSGQWASVAIAVRSRYKETLRTNSAFWVQKPTVQSGWLASNIRASELGSLLTGPAVAYFSPDGDSAPLQPGARVRGTTEPPEIPDDLSGPMVYVESKNGGERDRLAEAARTIGASLAGVSYTFDEEGLFRRTHYAFEGTALLLRAEGGRVFALTTQSLSDGRYVVSDTFSEADLRSEQWKIRGASGWISDATPTWHASNGGDLALLELKAEVGAKGLERNELGARFDPSSRVQLVAFRGDRDPEFVVLPPGTAVQSSREGVYPIAEEQARSFQLWTGALVLDDQGHVVGTLGRIGPLSNQAAILGIELLGSWQPQTAAASP